MTYTPPTIITGRLQSRIDFHPSLYGVLRSRPDALIVDIALLPSVAKPAEGPRRRRIVIIASTPAELTSGLRVIEPLLCPASLAATNHAEGSNNRSYDLMVAGRVTQRIERAAIRLVALTFAHCGVVLAVNAVAGSMQNAAECWSGVGGRTPDTNLGRAWQMFERIVALWAADVDEARVRDVWGESQWALDQDNIIVPNWDSEPKIRAVVDAAELSFDAVVALTDISQQPDVEDAACEDDIDVGVDATNAADASAVTVSSTLLQWHGCHNAWLGKMAHKLNTRDANEQVDAPRHDATQGGTRDATAFSANEDFFQRLLSSSTRL